MRTHRCQITIHGGLGEDDREAFRDFDIEPNGADTVLIGELDQSGLRGVLNRVQALGLRIVDLIGQAETHGRLAPQRRLMGCAANLSR